MTSSKLKHNLKQAFSNLDEHEHSSDPLHSGNHTHASHEEHAHHHEEGNRSHDNTVWRGVLILAVLLTFFVVERLLSIFGEWKQRLQSSKQVTSTFYLS